MEVVKEAVAVAALEEVVKEAVVVAAWEEMVREVVAVVGWAEVVKEASKVADWEEEAVTSVVAGGVGNEAVEAAWVEMEVEVAMAGAVAGTTVWRVGVGECLVGPMEARRLCTIPRLAPSTCPILLQGHPSQAV